MAMFATADDLADRLGVEFTAAEEVRAEALITRASGLVQAATGQTVELVTDDTLTLRGTRETSVLMPQRPIVEVTSVTIDGDPVDTGDWWVDGDEVVRRAGWGWPWEPLVFTYTHGYAVIPDAVKELVLAAASRVWFNPGSLVSERLGQAQMTYAAQQPQNGLLLTADETRLARRLLGRGSESLPIR